MPASLSVIIPAYNEAARLEKTLKAVVDYLRQNRPEAEVIVVDDGSADDTAGLARRVFQDARDLRTSVISYKSNLGKGRAVRLGLQAARGDVALFSDADLSTPISEESKLVEPIANGECDVAFRSSDDRSVWIRCRAAVSGLARGFESQGNSGAVGSQRGQQDHFVYRQL